MELPAFLKALFATAQTAATEQAARDKAIAKARKAQAAAQAALDAAARNLAVADDEHRRLTYYADADFARYQDALAARVPGDDGVLPYVDFNAYQTPPPTVEEWRVLRAAS